MCAYDSVRWREVSLSILVEKHGTLKQGLTSSKSSNEDTSVSGEVACSAFLAFSSKAVRPCYKIAQDTDLSEISNK